MLRNLRYTIFCYPPPRGYFCRWSSRRTSSTAMSLALRCLASWFTKLRVGVRCRGGKKKLEYKAGWAMVFFFCGPGSGSAQPSYKGVIRSKCVPVKGVKLSKFQSYVFPQVNFSQELKQLTHYFRFLESRCPQEGRIHASSYHGNG